MKAITLILIIGSAPLARALPPGFVASQGEAISTTQSTPTAAVAVAPKPEVTKNDAEVTTEQKLLASIKCDTKREGTYLRALCLARNLHRIANKSENDSDWEELYTKAKSEIRSAASKLYRFNSKDGFDEENLDEARDKYLDLVDAIRDSGDDKFASSLQQQWSRVEKIAKKAIEAQNQRDDFFALDDTIQNAFADLELAQAFGDRAAVNRAYQVLKTAIPRAKIIDQRLASYQRLGSQTSGLLGGGSSTNTFTEIFNRAANDVHNAYMRYQTELGGSTSPLMNQASSTVDGRQARNEALLGSPSTVFRSSLINTTGQPFTQTSSIAPGGFNAAQWAQQHYNTQGAAGNRTGANLNNSQYVPPFPTQTQQTIFN